MLSKLHTVHLIGIGGIGVSALARYFVHEGATVSGSDRAAFRGEEALRALGVVLHVGHSAAAVSGEVEAVIYSPAVTSDNPEREEARRRGIPEYSYPEALGALMENHYGVAVSGTNGKTTTTALLGRILEEAGKGPTVVVGGIVPAWNGNFLFGKGELFVAEGCEYRRHMLSLNPRMIVLTNIEEDHLDYYKDIEDIKNAFAEYARKLPSDGVLVYNSDDQNIASSCLKETSARMVSFSLTDTENVDFSAADIQYGDGEQSFSLVAQGESLGRITMSLPGDFNRANILAASAAAITLGIPFGDIARAVASFSGVERRFERVGEYRGASVISDYAHHPTAVGGTIAAAREHFPGRRIIAVFQPHQTNRTKNLFDEFVDSLMGADEVILAEIYQVAGREDEDAPVSSRDLVQSVNTKKPGLARYAATLAEVEGMLAKEMDLDRAVILVMGAGDIDHVARKLVAKSRV
ncbi:MAG: UDP-N-acetylmuramate--L-alanine ligase [Candidatus Yonathbacteria bacterium RIFCSPHIGHO2_01_FULL_51_10]|uniref:UDP-N-acetylmuramate--L-alanine ligase n=1 Tax=Candidatus Yonathbacteria bacterium RIFCSPHIGHO2_01_FULL_51_10 TaxID=1802723 RepID=A0A1G2S6M9_9BACT|nr:MAG: UDP-N-acetylmuramate--L-alanine ligase [Candidatus Yonathbacteria bacterium RIFCSPHIGHO2_01_FULL_51_10]